MLHKVREKPAKAQSYGQATGTQRPGCTSCVTDVGRVPTLHWGVIVRVLLWGCCHAGVGPKHPLGSWEDHAEEHRVVGALTRPLTCLRGSEEVS